MRQRKIRDGWVFRTEKKFLDEKPGIYFVNSFSVEHKRKLSDNEIRGLRDFFFRYLNDNESAKELCSLGRAKARSIIKGLNKIEAIIGEEQGHE